MALTRAGVGSIGFGAFKIGRNEGAQYAAGYAIPSDEEAGRLLGTVLDMGIRLIDTAPAYGLSEERIGRHLSHRRSEFRLCTKAGETFENGRSHYDFAPSALAASLERSLVRLRSDAVDVLLLHAARHDEAGALSDAAVEWIQSVRKRGLARFVGFSGYTEPCFRRALEWADVLMLEYHPLEASLAPILHEAWERNVAVMVKKPLASGRVAPERALPFILSHIGVTCAVVGSLRPEHLKDCLNLASATRPCAVPEENHS